MNQDEKNELVDLRNQLVELSSELSMEVDMPPEEKMSLIMAKIRTSSEVDKAVFDQAKKVLDEMKPSQLKLNAALDLIDEIELALGNVESSNDEEAESDDDQSVLENPESGEAKEHTDHHEGDGSQANEDHQNHEHNG